MQVDDSSIQPSGDDGFISLMSDQNFVGPSQHHQQSSNSSSRYAIDEEDDDDLGLGNSKPKSKPVQEETGNATTEEAAAQPTKATPPPAPEKKNGKFEIYSCYMLSRYMLSHDFPQSQPSQMVVDHGLVVGGNVAILQRPAQSKQVWEKNLRSITTRNRNDGLIERFICFSLTKSITL